MPTSLSPREGQILELVAEGLTSKAISGRLAIGESTVNWHLANVLRKLGASSRAEAVAIALRDGRLSAERPPSPVPPSFARERRRWQVLLAASTAAVFATPVLIAAAMFAPPFVPQDHVPPYAPTPARTSSTPRPTTAVPATSAPTPAPTPAASAVPPSSQSPTDGEPRSPLGPGPLDTPAPPVPLLPAPALPTPELSAPVLPTPALATPAVLTPVSPMPALPTPALPSVPRLP